MAFKPFVSIVMPLFNDEEYVAAAIDSCLAQTLAEIEILAVDDSSTDRTVTIVEEYERRDSRVRLIRQPENLSAFQARRAGIEAASASYVLFLDGDDELAPDAARSVLELARSSSADVVGFGVEIVTADGRSPRKFEAKLQPRHKELLAPNIVPQLLPAGEEANGHIWRYLFDSSLLQTAYADVPPDLAFYRANDIPITFLALSHATKYVSTSERLYRYHFRRGTSGHLIDGLEHFRFLVSGIEPISAIADKVQLAAERSANPLAIMESYESARLHIIANVLRYCIRDTTGIFQKECIAILKSAVSTLDLVRAAAAFVEEALPVLSSATEVPPQAARNASSVLLTTAHLGTGGLQGVLIEQAIQLARRGYTVTIAVMRDASRAVSLPPEINVIEVDRGSLLARLDQWVSICQQYDVDVVIDHHILYNENWPWFAMAALANGIPTIGWVHNFALRPLFDGSQRASFLATHIPVLQKVVTLSPVDVAFWKLRGLDRVFYLPNPAPQLAHSALAVGSERQLESGPIQLAWWGRLDPSTKQVQHLVEVAEQLLARGVDFRLRIIGPDSRDLTAEQVRRNAATRGVGDLVDLLGEQDAELLLSSLSDAHLLVLTSAIEGSPLTIIEAQAMGLPVAMYELPWLVTARNNEGLTSTPPGDPTALAEAIAEIARDGARYAKMSRAARQYAQEIASIDIGGLLEQLLHDTLPSDYSPDPTIDDAKLLLDWMVRFSERSIRVLSRGSRAREGIALRREHDRAQSKLQQVTNGPSFKIGRAITFLPRKIREALKIKSSPKEGLSSRRVQIAPPPLALPNSARTAPTPARAVCPDVSFIIPVYNSGPWLKACLESVLAQSEVNLEVICVEDGSTDESPGILQEFAEGDPRVAVLHQANSGQSVARNAGLEVASGRYIIYLDSDDYWSKDALASLVRRADSDNLDVLLFDGEAFLDGAVDEKTWRWYSTYYQRTQHYRQVRTGVDLMAAMRLRKDYRPHVGLFMARTEYVRRLNLRFIPGIVHQDNPYTFRTLLNAESAAHENVSIYSRRIRPGSTITGLTADRSARGYYLSLLEMSRELASRDIPKSRYGALSSIVDSVYEGARKQFEHISSETAEQLRDLDRSDEAQAAYMRLRNQRKERNV